MRYIHFLISTLMVVPFTRSAPIGSNSISSRSLDPHTSNYDSEINLSKRTPPVAGSGASSVADPTQIACKRTGACCAALQTCQSCTADTDCEFSTVTFKCSNVSGANAVNVIRGTEGRDQCPAVVQQSSIFPGVPGKKTGATVVEGKPAGIPTPDIAAAFTLIAPHIFTRESPARPDSGQHLKSVWLQFHPTGPKSVPNCNATTGLCTFTDGSATGKTVWDDGPGQYTQNDVKNMCSMALALSTNTAPRHVIMTKKNQKICIQATRQSKNFKPATGAGQGSCFPVGTGSTAAKLGSTC